MLGTTSTQQFFASANSVAATPTVLAEWNYNAFVPPFVTWTGSTNQILDSSFNSTASWSNADITVGKPNSTYSVTGSGVGITSIWDTTASALSFTILKKLETPTNDSPHNSGDIRGAVISNYIQVPNGTNFYKFVFYVKSSGSKYSTGFPPKISASDVSTSVSSTASPSTYYYRVVPVNSQGISPGVDLKNNTDRIAVSSGPLSTNTLTWSALKDASAYKIYRSTNKTDTYYLSTTTSTSYADDLTKSYPESYSPGFFGAHVYVVPEINLYDNSSNKITNSLYFIKYSESQYGQTSNANGSIEAKLDGWSRVEVYFGTTSDSKAAFSQIRLTLNMQAELENAKLLVDNIQLYPITEFDYFMNNLFPSESSFQTLRPGESLTNNLLPDADKRIKRFSSNSIEKPVSFAVKSPSIYTVKEKMNPQIQMLHSSTDNFQYYISSHEVKALQAKYNQYLSVNKIVIKTANSFTTISTGSVVLYTGTSGSTVIPMTGSFNSNGCTVLYYNGSTWSTNPWTIPPSLTSSGTFQNIVSNVSGIGLLVGSVSTDAKYLNDNSLDIVNDSNHDFDRIHVIELSPRLEINLTDYLLSYSIKKEISSGQSAGFPFSYLNSNSGNISFSNIPVYSGTNSYSVFENSANNGTFKDLLRQGIKITGYLSAASFSPDFSGKIPQFSMYTNQWQVNDIDTVSVDLYDITKNYLQVKQSARYFAFSSNLFEIITTLLAVCGFSDYDYDSLYDACSKSSNTSIFWSDEDKTIMECLQDLFIIHQIGGYVDEYGVLRFKNISQIYNDLNSASFNINAAITDKNYVINSGTTSSITYIPNIIPDSYQETINEKVGTIQIKYQQPMIETVSNNYTQGNIRAFNSIWTEDKDTRLGLLYVDSDFNSGQNYLQFNSQTILSAQRYSLGGFSGQAIVGDEFISYDGVEHIFYSADDSNFLVTKIINNAADVSSISSELLTQNPNLSSISHQPTGKVVGVKRGLFGSIPKSHTAVSKISDLSDIFNAFATTEGIQKTTTLNWAGNAKNYISAEKGQAKITSSNKNQMIMLSPTTKSDDYNLFAIDFFVPGIKYGKPLMTNSKKAKFDVMIPDPTDPKHKPPIKSGSQIGYTDYPNMSFGIFFNKPSATSNKDTFCVEISSSQKPHSSFIDYKLHFYKIKSDGSRYNMMTSMNLDGRYFDGTQHRLSIFIDANSYCIALDNRILVRKSSYSANNIQSGKNYFGAYLKNDEGQTSTVSLQELYAENAASYKDNPYEGLSYNLGSRYHFTTPNYLTDIVNGISVPASRFLFQAKPRFQGIKFYDVKYAGKPAFPDTVRIVPVAYGSEPLGTPLNNAEQNIIGPVYPWHVSYSNMYADPFGAKFLIVNNAEEIINVYLSGGQETTSGHLNINGVHAKNVTPETITTVINPGYQNSVLLESQWFASKSEAQKMTATLAKALDTFYQDIDITIFANPLLQVGDYVSLIYTLKGVGFNTATQATTPITCLVTSISQGWGQGGENTSLVLKPILY